MAWTPLAPKKREEAHAYLEAFFKADAQVKEFTVIRVQEDVDVDRQILEVNWPTPTKPLLLLIESDGGSSGREKQGARREKRSSLELRFWVATDDPDPARATMLNAAIYDVEEALRQANLPGGDIWGDKNFRFRWDAYRRLGGRQSLPPYAGASYPVEVDIYE